MTHQCHLVLLQEEFFSLANTWLLLSAFRVNVRQQLKTTSIASLCRKKGAVYKGARDESTVVVFKKKRQQCVAIVYGKKR